MKLLLFFLAWTLFGISCEKTVVENNSITGKWKLKEYYIDPGNGSGQWQAPAGVATIEFQSDGTVIATAPFFSTYDHYVILNDSTMTMTTSSGNYPMNVRYQFTTTMLTLFPPCIEGCGFRYEAIH